jgi:uncharacterized protein YdiU (UPF0061 family)
VVQLANALIPLVGDKTPLEAALAQYGETYASTWRRMLGEKLGIAALEGEADDALVNELFELLPAVETDMTLFFRLLAAIPVESEAATDAALTEPLRRAFYSDDALRAEYRTRVTSWLHRYAARVRRDRTDSGARRARMNLANPKYVLRNYLAQQAIDALAQDDHSVINRLMTVLQRPYDEQPEHDDLAGRRPEWARHKAGCSALSCSS